MLELSGKPNKIDDASLRAEDCLLQHSEWGGGGSQGRGVRE